MVVENEVSRCFDIADTFFNHRFKRPRCSLKQRGRAAGTAHLQKNEVRFNEYMLLQDPEHFLKTVVPHEVAHIVVFQIYGADVKPHGKEWQAVMLKVYGIKPDRTHTFETPPKNVYLYVCDCQEHQLTIRRHNRIERGCEYICKVCKSGLRFKERSE